MTNMSEQLKKARKKLSVTQKKFADMLGVTHNYIAQIEMGRRIPSLKMLLEISKLTDCEVQEFLSTPEQTRVASLDDNGFAENKPMTVGELKKRLETIPDDMFVGVEDRYGIVCEIHYAGVTRDESGDAYFLIWARGGYPLSLMPDSSH